jgi:hypothetical protein
MPAESRGDEYYRHFSEDSPDRVIAGFLEGDSAADPYVDASLLMMENSGCYSKDAHQKAVADVATERARRKEAAQTN